MNSKDCIIDNDRSNIFDLLFPCFEHDGHIYMLYGLLFYQQIILSK